MSSRRLALVNGTVLAAALLAAGTLGPGPEKPAAVGAGAGAAADPAAAAGIAAGSAAGTAAAPPGAASPVEPPVPPPAASAALAATPEPGTAAPAPAPRLVQTSGWRPYAAAGPVLLHAPADVVEVVGFHQSGHDGAVPQTPAPGLNHLVLESRSRDTAAQGAADVVVAPQQEVRAPVTGTVLRGGTYTLYCDHVDEYLVVEPDARPGWEVKLLHFEGLRVGRGDRVEGGVTVVGSRARVLPFRSQVDEQTAAPHWPHVHVEVVDPSVPDRPSGGGCD